MGAALTVDPMTFRNPVQIEIRYSGPAGFGNNFDIVTDEIHNRVKADAIMYGAMKDFQLVFYDYPLKGYHESFEIFLNGDSIYVGVPDTDGPEMDMIIERIYKDGLGDSAPEGALEPYFKSRASSGNREVEPVEEQGLPDEDSAGSPRRTRLKRSKMVKRIADLEKKLAAKEAEQESQSKESEEAGQRLLQNKVDQLEEKLRQKEAKQRKSMKENEEMLSAFNKKKQTRLSLKKRLEAQLELEAKLEECFDDIEELSV